jgi:cobalamin biosynthesis Mg chelatase CobN
MVNEVVGSGDWSEEKSLGETWKGRNVFSYGRNEGGSGISGTARPKVLEKLLNTTERIVQEIDSVEYGLTDIQVSEKYQRLIFMGCQLILTPYSSVSPRNTTQILAP